jgi:hypothetical protein
VPTSGPLRTGEQSEQTQQVQQLINDTYDQDLNGCYSVTCMINLAGNFQSPAYVYQQVRQYVAGLQIQYDDVVELQQQAEEQAHSGLLGAITGTWDGIAHFVAEHRVGIGIALGVLSFVAAPVGLALDAGVASIAIGGAAVLSGIGATAARWAGVLRWR